MSSRLVEPKKALPTLAMLWSGKYCPHETSCACRQSGWCPEARREQPDGEHNYPMLHISGCSFSYNHCCCRVLDEIEQLANRYLDQAGVREPPVPLDIIHLFDRQRAIEIRPLPLRRFLGCTWLVEEDWVIHLNSNSSPEVNNFTAFHEGFHIVCGNSGLAFRQAGERYKKANERLADYFAASILMPRKFVDKLWPGVKNTDRMASIFHVPPPVMKDWLVRLHAV